jgi:hypothetical protein
MILLKLFGVAMIISGAAGLAVGGAAGVTGATISGVVVAVSGVGLLVLDRMLAPVMRSSRELAEQSGRQMSRLTGAPKLRPTMASAADTMARAQEQMSGLMGTGAGGNGISGRAVVKAARDTGQRHNLNPVYEVDLVVTPDDGGAYDVTVQTVVNTLAIAQCVPGTNVSVKVDRSNRQKLVIDWMAVAGGGGVPS